MIWHKRLIAASTHPIITRRCCRHLCSVFASWEPATGASVTCCSTCGPPEDPAPENTDMLRNQPGPGPRPADRRGRTSPETSRALRYLKSTERQLYYSLNENAPVHCSI